MGIHRAVATSLMVITLVSLSGTGSYVISGRSFDFTMTALFAAGGVLGMILGTLVGRRISGPALQKGFSMAMIAVAALIVIKSVGHLSSDNPSAQAFQPLNYQDCEVSS
jgi:uncharacterized membrane protein YfcA